MEARTPPPEDVDRLRAAIERAGASTALRLRVEQQIKDVQTQRRRRRRTSMAAFATAGVLAAAVVAFVLPGSSPPSVAQVARAAAEAPQAPAPPPDRADPRRLTAHVDDIWFPSWRGLRWRAVGRSSTPIAGRTAETVYYAGADGTRIAYTIVAGGTLPWPDDTRAVSRQWMRLHVYSEDGRRVITWRWHGHQCVIAAPRSVSEATLLTLAADEA